MTFDLGAAAPLALDVFDANNAPANANTVTLTVTQPDGSTVTPGVTNPPSVTGQYRVTFVPTMSGRHLVRWVTTVPNTAYTDAFDVAEAAPPLILPLNSIKNVLGIDLTDHTQDEDLRDLGASVTLALENYKNTTIVQRTFTERQQAAPTTYWTGGPRVRCLAKPIISLTSVVAENGSFTWDVSKMYADPVTGIITVLSGPPIAGRFILTYIAGLQVIPRNYLSAAETLSQHLWEARRGPGGVTGVVGPEELGAYRTGGGMPRKVIEDMGPPFPAVM